MVALTVGMVGDMNHLYIYHLRYVVRLRLFVYFLMLGVRDNITTHSSMPTPKSRRSLLPGVYARGSKIAHTGGKSVTCRGLHILA